LARYLVRELADGVAAPREGVGQALSLRPVHSGFLMRATAEPVEGNRIRLSIQVDEIEVDTALAATVRRLGRQVRIPGFRPGKVPRQVLEARFGGLAALRQQAISDLLPDLYARAVADTAVDPISAPEIDVRGGDEPGPLTVDAVVEVRPDVSVAGYLGLQVTVPDLSVTDEEVDRQIDRLREHEGELVDVERPVHDGDFVTVDLHASRPGVDDMDVEDFVYEVGSGTVLPGLDEHLRGASRGDVVTFTVAVGASDGEDAPAAPDAEIVDAEIVDAEIVDADGSDADLADGGAEDPGQGEHDEQGDGSSIEGGEAGASAEELLQARATIKDVQEKVLPEITDEWAAEASELSTVAELRQDLRGRLQGMKASQVPMILRERTTEALIALVSEDPPASMVEAEVNERLHDLSHRLEERNMALDEFLARSGRDERGLVDELRAEATRAVLLDLALRALADAEGIEVADEELHQILADMAGQVGTTAKDLYARLERAGRLPSVRSERRKAKALEWLEAHVELVDESGAAVSREDLQLDQGNGGTGTSFGESPDHPHESDETGSEGPGGGPHFADGPEPAFRGGSADGSKATDQQGSDSESQEGHDVEVDL